ncbi:MAG: hypothetical protein Q8O25_00955, partial [Sulfurisoma sp.]|nr:hypothetical protein [Sulfurisoma sp.]
LAEVAASEAGELLSVRRKSHLLHAQMYARLDTQAAPQRTAPTTTEFSRCRGATRKTPGAPTMIAG